jgi:integrase
MLTALNMAAYGGEVSALRWDEVNLENGEVVCRRPKTGVSRVAILWPEVLAGLKKLPRLRDQVFFSIRRSFTANLVVKTWRKYRDAAGLPDDLKFSQLRDAAFTVAATTSLDQARVLAGHRIGADHYVRRNPQFVAQPTL